MAEQELISTASKFISSLVKSLQIICNGHVDFNESIELIGHINVRVDHKFKYDCIVDEHVSKEGEDCSTTFLSNSYHSSPPARETFVQDRLQTEQDLSITALPASSHKTQQSQPTGARAILTESKKNEESGHMYGVNADSSKVQNSQENQMVFKLEGDDSNECMLLSTADGNYEPLGDVNDAKGNTSSSSWSAEDSVGGSRTRKRRKMSDQDPEDEKETKVCSQLAIFGKTTDLSIPLECPGPSGSSVFSTYSCPVCGRSFTNFQSYRLHAQSCQQLPVRHMCSLCPFVSDSRDALGYHFYSAHKEVENLSSDAKLISCSLCKATFKSSTGLRQHMEVKHSVNPSLKCPICGKVMYNKINLEGHVNQHRGVKPFQCTVCKKTFSYKQSLNAHQKVCIWKGI